MSEVSVEVLREWAATDVMGVEYLEQYSISYAKLDGESFSRWRPDSDRDQLAQVLRAWIKVDGNSFFDLADQLEKDTSEGYSNVGIIQYMVDEPIVFLRALHRLATGGENG